MSLTLELRDCASCKHCHRGCTHPSYRHFFCCRRWWRAQPRRAGRVACTAMRTSLAAWSPATLERAGSLKGKRTRLGGLGAGRGERCPFLRVLRVLACWVGVGCMCDCTGELGTSSGVFDVLFAAQLPCPSAGVTLLSGRAVEVRTPWYPCQVVDVWCKPVNYCDCFRSFLYFTLTGLALLVFS